MNFWNWRPTVELIGSFAVIDEERLELMQIQCCGAEVTAEEAETIADRVEAEVLRRLPSDGRLLLHLSVTTEPDDFKMHHGQDVHMNYSATANWLRQFVDFCRVSRGFSVF